MTRCNKFLVAIFVFGTLSSTARAAIDWTGSGRFYHQRWSFGQDGDKDHISRNREKLDFYVNGAAKISDRLSAQVRFRYYTNDYRDSVDAFHLNKANVTWSYGEGSFVKFGKMGVIDKNVGDHIRSYLDNRLGMSWHHRMNLGSGTLFVGASRFVLGDKADKTTTDRTTYYTPQLGYEMKMDDYHLMVGGTYHRYTALSADGDNNDRAYVHLGPVREAMGDYTGVEVFGRVGGELGKLGWHIKFSMFNNGEAPESAMDEDKSATLMGAGLNYERVSVMLEMNNSGTYAVNRAVSDTDWFGINAGSSAGHSTGEATKLTVTYKCHENMMPSLEFVQAERNNEGMAPEKRIEKQKFMMTRLSFNFMF